MNHFNFMIILVSLLALSLLNSVDFVSCQDPAPAPAPGTPAPGTPAPAPAPETPAPAPAAPVIIPTTIGTITKEPDLSSVPQGLLVPKGNNFAFILNARGNQKYQCVSTSKQWLHVDSEAMLINDKNDIQQHFDPAFVVVQHNTTKTPTQGGNYTWNSLLPSDNSQVIAKVVNSADSPQSTNNVPWELNVATFRSDAGRLSKISYILKINTNGGAAPPTDQCGVQYIDGFIQPVQYEADYLFYEGTLPGSGTPTDQPANPSESASSTSTSKTNDGYSSKPIGPGKLSWVAIVGFISVGVISF
ncbi:hypothetical protein RhiirA5_348245 [Rhizophagus irregularis]|uniref:Uncharacterized protein n=2 Tax=Rhizophagus irregularis TaxID=588596 RepID=U9TCQ2_RHIID|nr:hypothetical protein GLOIN_2v1514889 [Rhizophagus irregularis DAOM 181602=DAOM 197198]PKC16048.1 hypothetical protein RhiirA5_348245 [Rhizophagus irregularis]PKC74358.1 hypothetical protein RhiirA1_409340 [Rhizophagus irregularis]PKY15494.1 hypothetical protein RhiirB3_401684 [Rhizophagus irregularis]POG80694.1 hypothetical protein GLOIN_2v1514889 [Rhizophagus irregularis DAOM 181602=DAOM 197198]UZO24015.1 hypothetical protein OCT59_016342 [Rhizophagus irregularis]|eukprot:XP_025187560.1 hypothetical protein GLOIN_2v1514889 [Rhizophagus irregularis DAOM 181602=DAOM 197198]